MSARRRALIAVALLALDGVVSNPGEAASPPVDPGALAHCASMTAADERLACYDSLSRPKSSSPAAAPAGPPASSTAPAASSTAKAAPSPAKTPASTSAAAAPVAAAATAGTAAAGAAPAPEAKTFGLTKHPPPAAEGPNRIEAKVTRVDTDRLGNVRVSLDNGQAWVFNSTEALLRPGEAVTIKRGMVGSFLLTTADHRTYRAQRAQ